MLGAAWIGRWALSNRPKRSMGGSGRGGGPRPQRARTYADEHGVPLVLDTYDALLVSDEIDAVYNPLPNSHHAAGPSPHWRQASRCCWKKPFTANAEEARQVAEAAEHTGLVVMEAYHWRFHPQAQRAIELVTSGVVGEVTHVEAAMVFPSMHGPDDIRYRYDLAGGASWTPVPTLLATCGRSVSWR